MVRTQAIVLLGGGVNPDGSLPPLAVRRVDVAARLFHRGVAPFIICSGRCSLMADAEPALTEAAAMAAHARALGVPEEALLLEEKSKDTIGNAYFTMQRFLRPRAWRAIRVVTSDFHLARAAWVFDKILGHAYEVAFTSVPSDLPPESMIQHAFEECKLTIFLQEWLNADLEAAKHDEHALERLIWHSHGGYAATPSLPREEIQRRLDEIARIHDLVRRDKHAPATSDQHAAVSKRS